MSAVVVLKIKKTPPFYYSEHFLMNLFEFKHSAKMINGIGKNINGSTNCKHPNGFVTMQILKSTTVYKGTIAI